jgi:citrate synthase
MSSKKAKSIPVSIKEIFKVPYGRVIEKYKKRLDILKQKEAEFREYKRDRRQFLDHMLHDYRTSDNVVVEKIEPRIRALIRGMAIRAIGYGSPQSRYANYFDKKLEEILSKRETALNHRVRAQIVDEVRGLYDEIEPKYQLSTDRFVVDLGLKQTAAVVSADSLARGTDEEGRPIAGELYMTGFSIFDLIEHTDFIGSVGIMLKQEPLTRTEYDKLKVLMTSRARLTDAEKQIVDLNAENFSSDQVANAKLLMKTVNQVMLYAAGENEYVVLTGDPGDVFHRIADQGLEAGAKTMVATAYAVRKLLKKQGKDLDEMPSEADCELGWGGNFLRFLYGEASAKDGDFEERAAAMDAYFQLIRTHGAGNASTFSTRIAGSAHADVYAALSSGNNALSGDRHGFANFLVRKQVDPIYERLCGENGEITDSMIKEEIEKIWDKGESFQGIGHPVYMNDPERMLAGDPRKEVMEDIIKSWDIPELNKKLEFYLRWEEHATSKLEREKGVKNRFPANVDFLTAFLLQDRVQLPLEANPVVFEVGRIFGHLAHYMEAIQFGLIRSKTLYVGEKGRELIGTIR